MNLNLDKVPVNLDEAIKLLQDALSPAEKTEIKNLSSSSLHFSLGTYIRNEWSMWQEGNILNLWFLNTYGINHPDDMSGIILECLLNDLNGKPRRDKMLAKQFIEHWKKKQ